MANKKELERKLLDLKDLTPDARIELYQNEIRFEVAELFKESYPDNVIEAQSFYDQWFKSLIGFYDPDILMLNLFLDKDFISISNQLMRTGAFKDIRKSKLSSLMDELLRFLNNQWEANSKLFDDDEECFLRSQFGIIIPGISNSDWRNNKRVDYNPVINELVKWLDLNIDNRDFNNLYIAVILFVKIWNSSNQFSNENFNLKALVFYNKINTVLERRLNDSNAGVYVEFIQYLKERTLFHFSNIGYMPLLDESVSNRYGDGYLKQRAKNKKLYKEAEKLNEICPEYSFIELIQNISEDSPEYAIKIYEKTLMDKIEQFHFPSKNEIESINSFVSNENIEKVRDNLFRKLYLFEFI